MKTLSRYWIFLMAFILFTGCQSEEKNRQKTTTELPVVEITMMTVLPQEGHPQTEVVGTIRPVKKASISAKITGNIEELPVVLGARVQAGDLLAKIRADEISARVRQTKVQLEQASRNLEREKILLQKNAATAENVKTLEEMHRVAEAVHSEALTMLSYTSITAPFDGVITKKIANIGDLATPGKPLLQLENSSKLQVVASVPETLLFEVQEGNPVTIQVPVAGLDVEGMIAEVAPASDPVSRTATVKIDIATHPKLRSGQFARIFISGEQQETLFIPTTAIRQFGQMKQMFIIENNKAHLRLVRTGAVIGDQTEILAGLKPGEVIAVSNVPELEDGQPVTAVK